MFAWTSLKCLNLDSFTRGLTLSSITCNTFSFSLLQISLRRDRTVDHPASYSKEKSYGLGFLPPFPARLHLLSSKEGLNPLSQVATTREESAMNSKFIILVEIEIIDSPIQLDALQLTCLAKAILVQFNPSPVDEQPPQLKKELN